MNLSFIKKHNKEVARGKLIAVGGIPGSGSTTQINLLADSLTFAGFTVAVAQFPQQGNASSTLIEKYANGKTMISPYAQAVLYATNHMEAREMLEGWLAKGTIVIASNYAIANAARGGATILDSPEQIKFFRWVNNLEHEIFKVPKPDLNIILDMPTRFAQMFSANKEAIVHGKLEQDRDSYLHLAKVYPQAKIIHCASGLDILHSQEIHNIVWQLVRRIVLKNSFK